MKIKACPKCGKVLNLRAWNCGYSSFDVSGVTCETQGCDYELKWSNATMSVTECFRSWNKHVDKALTKAKAEVRKLERMQKKMGASQNVDVGKGEVLLLKG